MVSKVYSIFQVCHAFALLKGRDNQLKKKNYWNDGHQRGFGSGYTQWWVKNNWVYPALHHCFRVKCWTKWNLPERNIKKAGRWQPVGVISQGQLRHGQMNGWLVAGCYSRLPQERIAEHTGGSQEAILHWYIVEQVFARNAYEQYLIAEPEEQAHTGFVRALWRIGKAEPKINSLVRDYDLLTSKIITS